MGLTPWKHSELHRSQQQRISTSPDRQVSDIKKTAMISAKKEMDKEHRNGDNMHEFKLRLSWHVFHFVRPLAAVLCSVRCQIPSESIRLPASLLAMPRLAVINTSPLRLPASLLALLRLAYYPQLAAVLCFVRCQIPSKSIFVAVAES